jgi:2-keto-4-pentenoate hydratase
MTLSRPTPTPTPAQVDAAKRLRQAARTLVPCRPVRDLIDGDDVDAAYAVQQHLTRTRVDSGARIVGRKIGLTSPAVQAQLGVDQPDFGVLFDDMAFEDGAEIPTGRLLQPKVEAEVAFILGADLVDGPLEVDQVAAAVAHGVAALEVVDSRIADWDITFGDTVADNASSGVFVLGSKTVTLDILVPRLVDMTMELDGHVVSQGNGVACLGDPLVALAWLAGRARELGDPLRAGQVVLSGALGPMVAVTPGASVVARLSGLGTVSASFQRDVNS